MLSKFERHFGKLTLGKTIEILRKRKDMTQIQLAIKIDVCVKTLRKIERDEYNETHQPILNKILKTLEY